MNYEFAHEGIRRTVFGAGAAAKLGEEVKLLGAERVLVVIDPQVQELGAADAALASLEQAGLEVFSYGQVTREPEPTEADAAAELGRGGEVQAVVGIGGGSAMDLAKAAGVLITNEGQATDYVGLELVKNPGKPVICVPTTAGTGSEVTFTAVFTRRADQFKGGINGRYLYPHTAILDPLLTVTCPAYISAIVGLDALTHAMEAYTSLAATPLSDMNALQAIGLIGGSLRQAVANGNNLEARRDMLLGAYLAGLALAQAGVGAVHAMAYPLGAFFDIPHGEANATLLPFVLEHNHLAAPERFADMAEAFGEVPAGLTTWEMGDFVVDEVYKLNRHLGIPSSLSELGVPRSEVERLAEKAMTVARPIANNPRQVTAKDLEGIYQKAFGV
ncbi:MAG: iron-containing alcohol dehydrogenase [Deltaproteobacteria bacterium]|nr:iron-containing alcohol dehydrogenase [Deltaproteobacteria bacterium]MCB2186335.1 iron-containing alcohol dehydrogenase [Deltaproteobacteria bacterium]